MRRCLSVSILVLTSAIALGASPKGYYRYPAIRGDSIVFVAEGDLFRVNSAGGVAQRMTSHADYETRPTLSPDGQTVAFSASYEGPTEVYTMPLDGGLPTRQTFIGRSAIAVGWTPDGDLMYATRKRSTLPSVQLFTANLESGRHTLMPLSQAADGCFDDDGVLYFTRFARQPSHTKRYKGGTAQDIWSFRDGDSEAKPLTADFDGTSSTPMCWSGRIYFISDRDGTMNLWSMRPDGGDLRRHTDHSGWDVKEPDLDRGRIVYQLGADIRLLDLTNGEDREVPISLVSDFDRMRERWVEEPFDYLSAWDVSPDGDRVVLTARGDVFVAPVKQGRFVEVTHDTSVRYRQASFLPDGKTLVVLSDKTGEVEWWKLPASGIGEPEQITHDGKVLRFDGVASPDGKWIAHDDQDQELWITRVEDGESTRIDFSPMWGFDTPAWSPDSRWLAWSRGADNTLNQIFVYNVDDGTQATLTTDRFDSYSPTWSPDGKWIYFLSDREFRSLVRSPWGSRAPEPFFERETRIFAIPLVAGLRSPFRPGDELTSAEKDTNENATDEANDDSGEKKAKKGKKGKSKDADKADDETDRKAPPVEIEFEGIRERIQELPIPRGNYSSLFVNKKFLFWIARDTAGDRTRYLKALKIDNDDPEAKTLVEGVSGFRPSADGKKLLVRKGNALYVVDASSSKADLKESRVALEDWELSVDPRLEWRQMFVESWRLERDYFYDRGMHGVDWKAMLDKYLPLVDRVTDRAELSDLQAQLAGELSALHIFVGGGDHREGDDDVDPASLGAVWKRDDEAGGYRIEHVYRSDPDYPDDLAPLASPGVDVVEGDVIESINGISTLTVLDPAVLLRRQSGKQVRLRVRPADGTEARDVIVVPISSGSEAGLRYREWEYTRRLWVDEQSDDQIGYVHLRAMGGRDIDQWYRDFYPVYNRAGLIIDARNNRGGNIDSWILEKLIRRAWFYWQPRVGAATWNMQYAFRGHMVVLVNEQTASDGEAFAEGFRRLGLGKVIGIRTWGGEIWLTSSNRLVDRGIVTAAEFGVYGPEGGWLIEGRGVEPDIVVDNPPHATFKGEDAQLRAAVEHLKALIREDPRPVPATPGYPDKSGPR